MFPVRADIESEYYEALRSSHRIRVRVELLDRYERVRNDLTLIPKPYAERGETGSILLDGEIAVDVNRGGPTRTLSIDILTQDEWLFDDPDSPMWLTDYIKVHHGVWLDSLKDYYEVPMGVFTIDQPSMRGRVLHIEGADKGRRAMDPFRTIKPYSDIKRNWRKSAAIEDMLRFAGETKFKVDECPQTMGKDRTYPPDSELWVEARAIAASSGWALFYDGDGYLTFRPKSTSAVWRFAPGEESSLLSDVEVTHDIMAVRNYVHVKGAGTVSAVAKPPIGHPLHPDALDPDAPVYMPHFVEDSNIATKAQARAKAADLLDSLLWAGTTVTMDTLVIPTLEEYDRIRIEDPASKTFGNLTLEAFSIPLGVGVQRIGSKYRSKVRRR